MTFHFRFTFVCSRCRAELNFQLGSWYNWKYKWMFQLHAEQQMALSSESSSLNITLKVMLWEDKEFEFVVWTLYFVVCCLAFRELFLVKYDLGSQSSQQIQKLLRHERLLWDDLEMQSKSYYTIYFQRWSPLLTPLSVHVFWHSESFYAFVTK